MTFIFHCHGCGSILYEDSTPVLKDGTYKKETYVESVISKVGGKCPYCRCELNSIPLEIDVIAPRQLVVGEPTERLFPLSYRRGRRREATTDKTAICVGAKQGLTN